MNVYRIVFMALAFGSLAVFAQQPAPITLPDLNAAEWFDGKMGGTFGAKTVTAFAKSNRVAIGGFRVVFVTHNEARAFVRASYMPGRETGSARAKMEVDLKGVDDATMQAITDRAYALFVEQLKAAGREVVPVAEIQPAYAAFKTTPAVPQEVTTGLLRGKAFTPAGMPLWWQIGDAWGDAGLGQKNMRAFNELSKSVNAPVTIAPLIVIDFAHMQSSGNRSGFLARRAEVGAALAMSIPTFYTRVVRAEQTRYGGLVTKGDDGALTLTQVLDTDVEFADLDRVDTKTGRVLSLTGADSKSKKFLNVATTTNEAYSAAAAAVLAQATGTFAKLFAANPAAK
ncbi:MAG: hypothetical protein QOH21_104 [Acidobacteriota bacterium]|jgi:hypothetical protein|nr:hypothetical protein [Acidobacteriota bacterium]